MSLSDEYDKELKYWRVKVNEERWKHVLNFRKCIIEHGRWQGTTGFHSLRKLSDSFFKYEKKRFISRPNFILCLDQSNIPIDGYHAYSIYDTFDSLQKNEFDWRIFVFMLFVTFQGVHKDVKFLLRYAFRFYVGHIDDIGSPCNSEVQLLNLDSVLSMLIRPDKVDALILYFDEEWRRWTGGVTGTSIHMDSSISFKITYDRFSRMLENIAIFNDQESDDAYLRGLEQEYYSSALYKHRRCLRYMDYFIVLNLSKIKRDSFSKWRTIVKLRKRARWLCNSINRRISIAMLTYGFGTLWYNIIIHIASIVIQCAYRVSSAKSKVTQKRTTMSSATIIQTRYKGYSARVTFAKIRADRITAVICIQRCIRGRIGRHLAYQRRLTLIDKKRLEMFKQAEHNYYIQIEQCAINMQRRFRNKSTQQRFYDIVEKKRREFKVISDMNSLLLDEEKEKMVHKRQSQIFAKNVFDQKRNQLMVQRKTKIDKDRLQALHLKMKDKHKLEMESLRYKQNFEYIKRMKEKLKDEYCEKADQYSQTFKKQCSLCLRSPGTTTERKKNREMKKRINERVRDVLKRATSRGIKMETDEARLIAEKELISILVQDKRAEIHREMEIECINLETRLMDKFKENEKIRNKQRIINAKNVLVDAMRNWLAKKELRQRCLETYEKAFDTTYKAFYYKNVKTGEVSWQKPKALGPHLDIPTSIEIESLFSI